MKYLMLMHGNKQVGSAFSVEDVTAITVEHDAFEREIRDAGEYISGNGLAFEDEAKVVRVVDGIPVVTDGPYLKSNEFIGSYYIVDVETVNRAIDLAVRLPAAKGSCVELWPVMDESGMEM